MHPRLQGDFGEPSAAMSLTAQGARVSKPIGHCPDYDLIADFGDRLCRVEVKTCTRRSNNRWVVQLCTHGGNQSWTGTVKLFDRTRCDYVFIQVGDGRCWFIAAEALDGGRAVALGGPKYAEYEVEPGRPIPDQTDSDAASRIAGP
jgi:Holliday junction resolvase-like predicted endonuclease